MKKLFTSMALLIGSLAAMATDYQGTLAVVVDGSVAEPLRTTIALNKQDNGKYSLALKNFVLVTEGESMGVGTITLKDIEAAEKDGQMLLETKQDIIIENGDDPNVPMWAGPLLGEIPVELDATIKDEILNADIVIPFMGMNIKVLFDSRSFQLPNAGFEDFHTAKAGEATSDEPNNWHSFMSSTGELAGFVSSIPHTFISEDVRPGSDGKKSVLIKSGMVLGLIVANGTLTTGQLKAGGLDAASTDNNAFIDLTNEAKDENGDPFYTKLQAQPDSISLWVKFKQGQPVPEAPYATMSAVITDGSYYQEPADKDYSDIIVGRAGNNQIESTGEWQRLTVPFAYSNAQKTPQAILVTLSTNAQPGAGTGEDELYVDDVELIYNSQLSAIKVNGASIPGFAADKYEYEYTIESGAMPTDEELLGMITVDGTANEIRTVYDVRDHTATINVLAADLLSSHTYVVKFKDGTSGIEDTISQTDEPTAVYNLSGQKVTTMKKGGVYITKYADGKTVKVIKK